MADIEKVIKAIEDCVFHKIDCVDCYYDGCVFKHGDCRRDLLAHALELLKEQQKIVRCKDCKWWGAERLCENSDSPCFQNGCTHGNWFCADGTQKEE